MGTRSITRIIENGKPLLTFYRQFDGYPSGHGLELAKFLSGIEFVNGYNQTHSVGKNANGAGCMAAQLICQLKSAAGLGGIYIRPNDVENEEYTYTINLGEKLAEDKPYKSYVDFVDTVKCEGRGDEDSYDGDLAGFVSFCEAAQ